MAYEEKTKIRENHPKTPSELSQQTSFKVSKEVPAQGQWRKVKKLFLTFLLCAFVFLTGCATITTGTYQDIPVTSEPPGIEVTSNTGASITTPGSFKFVRNKDYTLFAEYSGCEPQQKELKHKLSDAFWTNLIWGVTSSAVDLASGASDEIVPNKVHFDFTPEGRAAENRKRLYLELNPDTDQDVRFAILNEMAEKGMTKNELTASLGEPDMIDLEEETEVFVYNNRQVQRYYFQNGTLKGTVSPQPNQQKFSKLGP